LNAASPFITSSRIAVPSREACRHLGIALLHGVLVERLTDVTAKHLRSVLLVLTRRGLRGVKLVISDAHEGLKKATSKVLSATWQRCRVHFMRNALAHVGAKQR
jgi:mutator family transposase